MESRAVDLEKAIKIIEEKQKELCPAGVYGRNYVYGSDREKWDEIIDALDALPTITPPNEALTLEQLREMDGQPVWVDDEKIWALLQVWDDDNIDIVFPMPRGCFHAKSVLGKKIYRRPPEGEEDT